jgi:hypothetical protein
VAHLLGDRMIEHKHSWQPDEHGALLYSCACGAAGRRNLAGIVVELPRPRLDPEDTITARPRPAEVMDCTGRVRRLNPDGWREPDPYDGPEL